MIQTLRRKGFSAETRYASMSLKAQMKLADKVNAKTVLIIGDNELEKGEVTVRNMRTRDQASVKIDAIVRHLQGENK
jgi:histidyl-tRNA synthetase